MISERGGRRIAVIGQCFPYQPIAHPRRFVVESTSEFLEKVWTVHAPRLWIFGHHHHDWRANARGTRFVCVGALHSIDITAAGEVLSD